MICPKCKSEIPEKVKFCPECGATMASAASRLSEAEFDRSVGDLRTIGAPTDPASPTDRSLGSMPTMVGPGDRSDASEKRSVPLAERYEIIEEVGRGGFATVFKARDKKLNRIVAVKRLRIGEGVGQLPTQTIERFRREAQAIANLNHRNIVMVYDHNIDDEGDYIVMEYVGESSLRDHLKAHGGKLPVADALNLIRGVAQGLAYAHRMNLVHRDIKPANVLLQLEDGELVPNIVDFGLARSGSDSDLSQSGYGMGTPYYMAPEQRRDAKSVNHTADIYSMGKTLYEMLSGEVPDTVDPSKIPSPALSEIIFKCIKNNPSERYFSVEEFLRDLGAIGQVSSAGVSVPSAGGAGNACPSCGSANEPEAKYCVGCGQGLFRECPECATESTIHRKYCAKCGTDIEAFLKTGEALVRMRRMLEEKRYSRVAKEHGLLPVHPRMTGTKGRKLLAEAAQMNSRATAELQACETIETAVKDAVARKAWGEARAKLDEYGLHGSAKDVFGDLIAEVDAEVDEADWKATTEQVAGHEGHHRYEEAHEALDLYLVTHAEGRHAAEAKETLKRLDDARASWEWEEAVREADVQIAAKDLEKAQWVYESFAEKKAGHPQATEARKRGDDLAWQQALGQSRAAEEEGRFKDAHALCMRFLKERAGSMHMADARTRADAVRKAAQGRVKELIEQALAFEGEHRLVSAMDALQQARDAWNDDGAVAAVSKRVVEARASASELKDQAEMHEHRNDHGKAAELYRQAAEIDREDEDASRSHEVNAAKWERLESERKARLRRKRMITLVLLGAVAISLVAHTLWSVFWRLSFGHATKHRNVIRAETAAGHLKFWRPVQRQMAMLRLYDQKMGELEGRRAAVEALLQQYDQGRVATLDELMQKCRSTRDLMDAMKHMDDAGALLDAFQERHALLVAAAASLDKTMKEAEQLELPRLMPDEWAQFAKTHADIASLRNSDEAARRYTELGKAVQDAFKTAVGRREVEKQMLMVKSAADDAMRRVNSHGLAKYAASERSVLAAAYGAAETNAARPVLHMAAKESFSTCLNTATTLLARLDVASRELSTVTARYTAAMDHEKAYRRLAPAEWTKMDSAWLLVKKAGTWQELAAAAKQAGAVIDAAVSLSKVRQAIESRVAQSCQAAKAALVKAGEHALAGHARKDIASLEQALKETSPLQVPPEKLADAEGKAGEVAKSADGLNKRLASALAVKKNADQLAGNLKAEEARLRRLAPLELDAAKKVLGEAEQADDLALYMQLLRKAMEAVNTAFDVADGQQAGSD